MAATPSQIVNGLKTRLATISGLRTFSYQPSQVTPPIGYPVLNTVTYHRAMSGGLVEFDATVFVVVGRYTDDRAFADLDDYLAYSGAKSIRAAIEGDETLGGVAQSLTVVSGASIVNLSQGDADFLQVAVQVIING